MFAVDRDLRAYLPGAKDGPKRRPGRISKSPRAVFIVPLEEQTRGVECRKDDAIVDEIPEAYKDIEDVMERSCDLVEVVAAIKQIVCVKG